MLIAGSPRNIRLSRAARFLFVPGWTLLLGANCEEFAYWVGTVITELIPGLLDDRNPQCWLSEVARVPMVSRLVGMRRLVLWLASWVQLDRNYQC